MLLSKQTRQLLTLLLICIGAFVYFQNEDTIKQTSNIQVVTAEKPSAYAEQSLITYFDKDGIPSLTLKSQNAFHFENKDLIVIEKPEATLLNPDKQSKALLTASEAVYEVNNNTLNLNSNVTADLSRADTPPWRFNTQHMVIELESNFIKTDQPVTITNRAFTIESIGLEAWLDKKEIKLLSSVRGNYDPEP